MIDVIINNEIHAVLLQETQQQQQCTHVQDSKLIYAELCTPVVNTISQPSSVEDTAYAVINHTDRTN